jgi:hypothetical protein
VEKKPLPTNENADVFIGMVKRQPGDISMADKTGTFLLWYDTLCAEALTFPNGKGTMPTLFEPRELARIRLLAGFSALR